MNEEISEGAAAPAAEGRQGVPPAGRTYVIELSPPLHFQVLLRSRLGVKEASPLQEGK